MEVCVQPCRMIFISKNALPHGSFQNIFHPPNREFNFSKSISQCKSLKESAETVITNYFYLNSIFTVNNQINVKTIENSPLRKTNPHAPEYESAPFPGLQGRRGNPISVPAAAPCSSHSAVPLSDPWAGLWAVSCPCWTRPQERGTDSCQSVPKKISSWSS